jgi:hypothetical protein
MDNYSKPILVLDTPEGIEAYRLLALRSALKLEILGMRFKGGRHNAANTVREHLNVKTRDRNKLLAQYEDYLREWGYLR